MMFLRTVGCLLALVMACGVLPVQAQGVGVGNSYHFGNPLTGDLGGYYGGGGQEINIGMGLNDGVGLKIGCDGIDIMGYMKAQFNVSQFADRAQEMMKTFLAKQILTQLLSISEIAAAQDYLQKTLNDGFNIFNQNCDMGEIRKKAKQVYIDRECSQFEEGSSDYINCVDNYGGMKSRYSTFLNKFNKQICSFMQNPTDAMRGTLCGGDNPSTACIMMSYLPRACYNSATCGKQVCVGGENNVGPPITMARVADANMLYVDIVSRKTAKLWDEVRAAYPKLEEADIKAIAIKGGAMAEVDLRGGSTTAAVAAPTGLMLTSLKHIPLQFAGSDDADKMLEKFLSSNKMAVCKANPKLYDPLRIVRFIAKAANAELERYGVSERVNEDIKVEENEKVDAGEFFNLPAPGTAAANRLGIDAETASEMLEKAFGCTANTDILLSNPAALADVAISPRVSFDDYHRGIGQRMSCAVVENVGRFILTEVRAARVKALTEPDAVKNWNTTVTNADGTTTDKNMGDVPADGLKDELPKIFDNLEKYLDDQLTTNHRFCNLRSDVGAVLRETLTPQVSGPGRNRYDSPNSWGE